RIQQEGVQKRKDAEKQIAAMRGDLQAKLTRQPVRELAQQESV
ncbi:toxic anion resistance protein, partial [Rhizobiaceae bacterium LC148]